jgi:hypothetical protein
MIPRTRLIDYRLSRYPAEIGLCQGDIAGCADAVNVAIRRLLSAREQGDTGWFGTWAKIVFNVSRDDPFITTPREVSRLINLDVCRRPVRVQNEFYEFLEFGPGLQDQTCPAGQCRDFDLLAETFDRGQAITFAELKPPNKIIRVYPTDARDADKRTLIQGKDSNGVTILSLDGLIDVQGVYVSLNGPFQDTPMQISELTGIQKDITAGPVKYYEVDTVTLESRLLLTMEPGEQVAGYRRYYFRGLPGNCCDVPGVVGQVQVTAMAKLSFIAAQVDTDYLLIGNLEAIGAECQAVRYGAMDGPIQKSMALERHREAIRYLQGELLQFLGKDKPAINFAPFGSAKLSYLNVAMT